jgi:hypothetical protein
MVTDQDLQDYRITTKKESEPGFAGLSDYHEKRI